ncbi:MAG TPA: YbjN domain-containing protein [Allosphingosinicella sp.]|nr:YbjN domain-containing protein [Allosphingosinicella sp.]
MMRLIGWTMAIAVAAAAMPAQAQLVSARNPETLVGALQAAGYTAKLEKDGTGDPMIRSAVNGHPFRIVFYGCKANKNCATVTFAAGFDKKSATGLASINAWNRKNRFGRAYLDDEGDPILGMDVDLDDGGMSSALFTDNLEFWTAVTGAFQKHIEWDKE